MKAIRALSNVTAEQFEQEIVPAFEPVVLHGLVAHWPAVAACNSGFQAAVDYLRRWDAETAMHAVLARPSPDRQLGYAADGSNQNFIKDERPLTAILEQLWRYSHFPEPPSVAVQSALVAACLPGFELDNVAPLVPAQAKARIWIGNQLTVGAHFDNSLNIACVVAGQRTFTLLPPMQVSNLYLGPPDATPAGAPTTMASLKTPDFERFPKLREALAHAQQATLNPGDAIYIPPLWFHQVESLAPLNILLNYWWRPLLASGRHEEDFAATLWMAALTFRHLPAPERQAWGALFQHLIFDAPADALDHIPPAHRSMLGEIAPAKAQQMRAYIRSMLKDE